MRKARENRKAVAAPVARTIARTGPYRFARAVLATADSPIVMPANARTGPLQVAGTPNLKRNHVGTSVMKKPAQRPISQLRPENVRSGRQSIPLGPAARGRAD